MAPSNSVASNPARSTRGSSTADALDGGVVQGAGDAVRSLSFAAPLHPILVHFTIALTSASLLFDVLGRAFNVPGFAVTGWWTLALSAAATVLTLATGVASRACIDVGEGEARSYLRLHMALGPAFFGLLVAMTIWRSLFWSAEREVGWAYLAAMTFTAAVMAVQGYAGGELVYRWGADVEGRHRDLRQHGASEPPPRLPGTFAPQPDAGAEGDA